MEIFNLTKIRHIIVINSCGEEVHRFTRNYLDEMEIYPKRLYHKQNGTITWLPIKPIRIKKWRVLDCFIWDGDLYLLDSFIKFENFATNTVYTKKSMSATKIFKWQMPDMPVQIISDCYAYLIQDLPQDVLITNTLNELANKDIAIGRKTLERILQYYTLTEKTLS